MINNYLVTDIDGNSFEVQSVLKIDIDGDFAKFKDQQFNTIFMIPSNRMVSTQRMS